MLKNSTKRKGWQRASLNRRRFLTCVGSLSTSLPLLQVEAAQAEQPQIPTARDSLGPFYVSNAPITDNLNRFGKKGEAMLVRGRVMDANSPDSPVAGAKLELWQTDGEGRYYPQGNGDVSDYNSDEIDMRGTLIADQEGKFEVMSLFPAEYWPRPSHIHYRITAEGFETLVTQHYLDVSPGSRPHRTAKVDRSGETAIFNAPSLYLARA